MGLLRFLMAIAIISNIHVLAQTKTPDESFKLMIQTGHEIPRNVSMTFSKDHKLLASRDRNGVILLWDIQSTRLVSRFSTSFPITKMAINKKLNQIVGVGNNGFVIWNLRTGDIIKKQDNMNAKASDITPDGRFALFSAPRTLSLYDTQSSSVIHSVMIDNKDILEIKIRANGSHAILHRIDKIEIVDFQKSVITGKIPIPYDRHADVSSYSHLSFSENTPRVATWLQKQP